MFKYIEIILVLFVGIYSGTEISKWKEISPTRKFFAILAILCGFVIAWNAICDIRKQKVLEKINSSFGELIDSKKATVPIFDIGNNTLISWKRNGVYSFPGCENVFKAFVKDDRLYLNMIIRNEKGEVIAAIYENIWTMFDKDYEYNDDEKAFEIVTKGERKLFLHVELKNTKILLAGFVFNENGIGWYFSPDVEYIHVIRVNTDNYSLHQGKCKIKNIFKYPREKYYGVRLGNN
jgi:hypothetical protein